jgi:hypothetical protein
LTDTRDIAMAKDTKAPGEKGKLYTVTLDELVFEKGDDGLGHRYTLRCLLIHVHPPIILDNPAPRTHHGFE